MGTYRARRCLSKSPVTNPPTLPGPPEIIGTLTTDIDAVRAQELPILSIGITFNGKEPGSYPYPIIIRSSDGVNDPERFLVTGGPLGGPFIVTRGTGKTVKSLHNGSELLPVVWTPAPLDDGSGTTAEAGTQVGVCIRDEIPTTLSLDAPGCPTQTAEPLKACIEVKSFMWAIGDLQMSR